MQASLRSIIMIESNNHLTEWWWKVNTKLWLHFYCRKINLTWNLKENIHPNLLTVYYLILQRTEKTKQKKSSLPPQAYQLQEARRFEFSSVGRHLAWENFPGDGVTKDLEPLNVNETLWKENKNDRQLQRFFGPGEQKAGKKTNTTKLQR